MSGRTPAGSGTRRVPQGGEGTRQHGGPIPPLTVDVRDHAQCDDAGTEGVPGHPHHTDWGLALKPLLTRTCTMASLAALLQQRLAVHGVGAPEEAPGMARADWGNCI